MRISSLIDLDKFQLKFTDTMVGDQDNYSLTMSAVVTIGQSATVHGDFQLTTDEDNGWVVQSIGLGVLVPGGIELVDGINLIGISGALNNINTPNWSISASATLSFGKAIRIQVPFQPSQFKNAYIVVATGSVMINQDELVLSASVSVGATLDLVTSKVQDVLIGTASGTVTLNWAKQLYELQVAGSFYAGIFNFNGTIKYYQSEFWVLANASINVPSKIPVIGGDVLASAGFAFECNITNGTGFFAAWVHLIVSDIGFEYDLDGTFKIIGRKTIDGIENFNPPKPSSPSLPQNYYPYANDFAIPDNAGDGISFNARWGRYGSDYYVQLNGPDGILVTMNPGTATPSKTQNINGFGTLQYLNQDPSTLGVAVPRNQYIGGYLSGRWLRQQRLAGRDIHTHPLLGDPARPERDRVGRGPLPHRSQRTGPRPSLLFRFFAHIFGFRNGRQGPGKPDDRWPLCRHYRALVITVPKSPILQPQTPATICILSPARSGCAGTLSPGTYYFYTVLNDGVHTIVQSAYHRGSPCPMSTKLPGQSSIPVTA